MKSGRHGPWMTMEYWVHKFTSIDVAHSVAVDGVAWQLFYSIVSGCPGWQSEVKVRSVSGKQVFETTGLYHFTGDTGLLLQTDNLRLLKSERRSQVRARHPKWKDRVLQDCLLRQDPPWCSQDSQGVLCVSWAGMHHLEGVRGAVLVLAMYGALQNRWFGASSLVW